MSQNDKRASWPRYWLHNDDFIWTQHFQATRCFVPDLIDELINGLNSVHVNNVQSTMIKSELKQLEGQKGDITVTSTTFALTPMISFVFLIFRVWEVNTVLLCKKVHIYYDSLSYLLKEMLYDSLWCNQAQHMNAKMVSSTGKGSIPFAVLIHTRCSLPYHRNTAWYYGFSHKHCFTAHCALWFSFFDHRNCDGIGKSIKRHTQIFILEKSP